MAPAVKLAIKGRAKEESAICAQEIEDQTNVSWAVRRTLERCARDGFAASWMTTFRSWQEFQDAAEALYNKSPKNVF